MQANACPAREPHISGASWWPVVARGGPWLWDTPELPRVSTRGSQNATNRGGGTVVAAHHCSVGAPGHATALGVQTGTVTPSCGLQSQPARKALSSRYRLQGENLHVCPCVGWPGEFAAPVPGGRAPLPALCSSPAACAVNLRPVMSGNSNCSSKEAVPRTLGLPRIASLTSGFLPVQTITQHHIQTQSRDEETLL